MENNKERTTWKKGRDHYKGRLLNRNNSKNLRQDIEYHYYYHKKGYIIKFMKFWKRPKKRRKKKNKSKKPTSVTSVLKVKKWR